MNGKIEGYINIAKKSGNLIIGSETLKEYKKKLYLLIITENASENIIKLSKRISEGYSIPCLIAKNLSKLVNIENCKIVGIKNKGIADAVANLIDRGENN